MDKRFVITVVAVLAVTIGSAALAGRPDPAESAPLHETVSGVDREPQPDIAAGDTGEAASDHAYVIREYEGRVAVFAISIDAEDSAEPEIILDTLVKYLPDYDRIQLQEGIPVKDYQQLVSLIEDFVS